MQISSWHVFSCFSASFSPITHLFGSIPYQLLLEATRHFALFNVSQSVYTPEPLIQKASISKDSRGINYLSGTLECILPIFNISIFK